MAILRQLRSSKTMPLLQKFEQYAIVGQNQDVIFVHKKGASPKSNYDVKQFRLIFLF